MIFNIVRPVRHMLREGEEERRTEADNNYRRVGQMEERKDNYKKERKEGREGRKEGRKKERKEGRKKERKKEVERMRWKEGGKEEGKERKRKGKERRGEENEFFLSNCHTSTEPSPWTTHHPNPVNPTWSEGRPSTSERSTAGRQAGPLGETRRAPMVWSLEESPMSELRPLVALQADFQRPLDLFQANIMIRPSVPGSSSPALHLGHGAPF